MKDWQATLEGAGYRRYPNGLVESSAGLYQRRLFRAADKDGDVFLNFDHFAPFPPIRDVDSFTAWVQIDSRAGWSTRIETFTHFGRDIVNRLSEIEAGLIALVDASLPTGKDER